VIEPRAARDGGPFLTMTCPRCRARCGALRNRRGAWLFYPLEGREAPSLVERIVPRTSRVRQLRARAWWLRNEDIVERFRASRRDPAAPPPPRPRAKNTKRTVAAAPPRPAAVGPREQLGVGADASLADVRRAWRAAVKRWHPDRIPTRDPVVTEDAARRFAEMRRAYELLVAELSGR